MVLKSYSELVKLTTYIERVKYLKLDGSVGHATFGSERYLNQMLYKSPEWKAVKRKIIMRDQGCDLGIEGLELNDRIYIHHINPITPKQILDRDPAIFDPENLISCSFSTHQTIHFGDIRLAEMEHTERRPNDTCPWKQVS